MSSGEIGLKDLRLDEALRKISAYFAQQAVDGAEADARLLLLGATGLTRSDLILNPDTTLDEATSGVLESFVARRLAGEPATRILGERSFWTLTLRVTPDALDPRPDSETIVAAALEALGPRVHEPLRVLDLGTGTGALLLAILSACPLATGTGVDLSPEACALARENAARNGLADRARFVTGCWADGLEGRFDLIVTNPPYIETAAIDELSVEVRAHDPRLALDGGADGLAAYRDLTAALPRIMREGAVAVFELGAGQGPAVAELADAAGLAVAGSRQDLGGIERALIFRAKKGGQPDE